MENLIPQSLSTIDFSAEYGCRVPIADICHSFRAAGDVALFLRTHPFLNNKQPMGCKTCTNCGCANSLAARAAHLGHLASAQSDATAMESKELVNDLHRANQTRRAELAMAHEEPTVLDLGLANAV